MKEDKHGYLREENHSNLWHRKVAYHKIYLKNKEKYPFPFEKYEVHHIDGDKGNNLPENLALLSPEEHIDLHLEKERKVQEEEREMEGITNKRDKDLIRKVAKSSGLPISEIVNKLNSKRAKLSGLISNKDALKIVAMEVGIYL